MKNATDRFSVKDLKKEKIVATYGTGANRIVAIENKFPTFQAKKGVRGYQEILVEGKKNLPFVTFSAERIEAVLKAYVKRAKAIRRIKGIQMLTVFKNEGAAAGASQTHAHSQLFGLSFVPKRVRSQKSKSLKVESTLEIYSDPHVIAFANPSGRFSHEVKIVTRRRIDDLMQTRPAEIRSLAKAIHALLPFVRSRKLSFNYYFHDVFANPRERFEIRFAPRENVWAGFELDTGVTINPVPAEQAAKDYLSAAKKKGKKG